MKIISYSLFDSSKKFNDVRYWDDYKTIDFRYWINIPAVVLVNTVLYPDYQTELYIDNSIKNSKIYPFLQYLNSDKIFNFTLHEIKEQLPENEPSCRKKMWRYIPIWNKNNKIVLPRDLDSLPNTLELKCSKLFESSECEIMTIRSHPHHTHTNPALRMLGGLSGFKPNIIADPLTYHDFYQESKKLTNWGLDQDALRLYFIEKKSTDYLSKKFMDCAINYRKENSIWPCVPVGEQNLNQIALTENNNYLLSIIDKLTDWAGKPIDSRTILTNIIRLTGEAGLKINKYFIENTQIQKIYYV